MGKKKKEKSKIQVGFYLKIESSEFIKAVREANDFPSDNYVANRVIDLGIIEYKKKLKKNLELK